MGLQLRGILATVLLGVFLAGCGAAPTSMEGMDHSAMEEMDHSTMEGMDHGTISSEGQPYDAVFIDSMIVHHEGAIIMANQALEQAERPEIIELANEIIGAQESEIGQMKEWRSDWYADLAETMGMEMDMGPMEVPAGDTPFEQRFIEAMIPHHEGAIEMARDALENAERQEIRDLANAVITAQEAEIAQMQEWLQEWYGVSR